MNRDSVIRVVGFAGFVGYSALAVSMAAVTLWATALSPDFPFLWSSADATWIAAAKPVTTDGVLIDRADLRPVRFKRRFDWNPPPGTATSSPALQLQIRALTDVAVWLNGSLVAKRSAGGETTEADWNWKRGESFRVEGLVRGSNRLEVDVRNDSGPALLALSATAPGLTLVTDSRWLVEMPGRRGAADANALLASDTQRGSAGRGGENGWRETSARRDTLFGIATLCGLLSLALRKWGGEAFAARFPWDFSRMFSWLCLGGVGLFWVSVFFKTSQLPLPPYWGYDGPDHLEYIRFIVERATLPLASDGAAMYHPPLFYLLSAGLLWLFPGAAEGSPVLRLLPFASGLTQVGVAFLLARRLFPTDRALPGLAALIAGLLPVNLYMSTYLSNEPMQAALSAIAILLVTDLLLRSDVSLWNAAALGGVIGLALLTKISALVLLPPALILLALKQTLIDGALLRRQLANLAVLVCVAALVAGWFYLRNWLIFGQAVIGNWDVPGARVTWWQHPGFHTSAYFLGFGESLRQPFFAGFHSFLDGVNATLWSDSLVGGVKTIAQRHSAWNYPWMAVLPVLSLPALAIGFAGVSALARESLRGDDLRRRMALAFSATVAIVYCFAVLLINIRLPFYAQAKASYALAALAPLAVAGAFAVVSIHRALDTPARRPAQVLFHAWAGTLAIAVLLAFGG